MIVHQLVHTLSYGDAISSEVLALQRAVQELGGNGEIYAIHVHPKLKEKARDYREFPRSESGEVILHYSLGSVLNRWYSELTNWRRSLIFHNLTPSHWFEGVNPRVTEGIRSGEDELPELLALSDRVIADSSFNAGQLRGHGTPVEVLELPVDPERWREESNPGIAALLRGSGEHHIAHVGRLAPNKCVEDIIRAFYFLRHHILPKSRLWLVGIDTDTELYSFSLRHLVDQLGLNDAVEFPGCFADSEVRALYENGHLYTCMSEHEGFCLPVLEAMHFGMPVIAYASTALPDTVSGGGILLNEKNPARTAELMAEVLTNEELRRSLQAAGKKRVEELSYERFKRRTAALFFDHEESSYARSA